MELDGSYVAVENVIWRKNSSQRIYHLLESILLLANDKIKTNQAEANIKKVS